MKEYKKRYLNETVQDIYYLIDSEFLLESSPGISLFPEKYNEILKEGLKEICEKIDVNNKSIEKLRIARGKRLGMYCEELLNEYFLYHPKIEVLEYSWQIIRNGITVGELDFILKIEDDIIGLETSFKCYLQYGSELEDWQGPNRKDALINKLEKVKNRQIPLFQQEEVESKYGAIPSYLFLKGHLFSRLEIANLGIKKVEFSYLYEDEMEELLEGERFYFFPKKWWVSGLFYSPKSVMHSKKALILKAISELSEFRSPIIGVRNKQGGQNYMIIKR